MRLVFVVALLAVCFVCSARGAGSNNAADQTDISRSGRDFLEPCSGIDGEQKGDPASIRNDATCVAWVEGFREGFTVHNELLGVPQRDRMACIPSGVTNVQIIRVMKKYIAENPDKAHHATKLIASLALARAFSCKLGGEPLTVTSGLVLQADFCKLGGSASRSNRRWIGRRAGGPDGRVRGRR